MLQRRRPGFRGCGARRSGGDLAFGAAVLQATWLRGCGVPATFRRRALWRCSGVPVAVAAARFRRLGRGPGGRQHRRPGSPQRRGRIRREEDRDSKTFAFHHSEEVFGELTVVDVNFCVYCVVLLFLYMYDYIV